MGSRGARHASGATALAAVVLAALVLTPAPGALGATTRQFPGTAPCDTTLQACIDGSAPGNWIEIVTDAPIHESLEVHKSITLTAGAGFHPVIGGASGVLDQDVRDTGGSAVNVTFSKIGFLKAKIDVNFTEHPGDRFSLLDSTVQHALANNNEVGVDVDVRMPGSITRIVGNTLRTTGQPIDVGTDMPGSTDHATVLVAGNTVTSSAPADSYHGITIGLGGNGTAAVDVFSNVFHHVMGCECGGQTAVSVGVSGSVDAIVDLVGNTIDDTGPGSSGIGVEPPSGTSTATVRVFDNIVTAAADAPIRLPASTPALHVLQGWNDFFGNGAPPDFGGYGAGGATNLAVNPQYVGPGAGNYRLRVGSPLRDAGQTCNPGGLSRGDAGSRFRVAGRGVDVGAFEIDAGPVPPGVNLFGGAAGDTLNGTAGADVICGMLGADTIRGGGGADHVYGGQGGDDLTGGPGADWLTGGPAPDDMFGGTGEDHVDGLDGVGGDHLDGGPDDDLCLHDFGDTLISCP